MSSRKLTPEARQRRDDIRRLNTRLYCLERGIRLEVERCSLRVNTDLALMKGLREKMLGVLRQSVDDFSQLAAVAAERGGRSRG